MTGKWPKYEIDHKDENKSNNRFKNLREATRSQNGRHKGPYKNNPSGLKGAYWDNDRKKWLSNIGIPGQGVKFLGRFNTKEEAHAAYCRVAEKLHGEFYKPR